MQQTLLRPAPCSTSYGTAVLPKHGPGRVRLIARATPLSMSDLMDRQFEMMDRQFEALQRQMDRDVDAAFSRARELERQADAEVQRALRESASAASSSGTSSGTLRSMLAEDMRSAPYVDIQRQEERGPGVYRYYERIQITSGGGGGRGPAYAGVPPPAATSVTAASASPLSPVLVGTVVLLGGYLTLTAAFNRNYPLTNYAESKRWLLLALWPLLVLFSPKFREQFAAAIRGERVGLRRDGATGGGGGSGSSGGGL